MDSYLTDGVTNNEVNELCNNLGKNKVYEDTNVLHETNSKGGEQHGRGKISSPTSDNHTSRKPYRKKHKLKHDKKKSVYNHYNSNGETVLSDSDFN